jgi:flagellar biogenesis protein FliO
MNRYLSICLGLYLGAFQANAFSATLNLKQIQVKSPTEIELKFDGKVERTQVQIDYANDIIQLSLNNVSVYPAKITPISDGEFTKVFAYQFSPRLVRCRLTVKGKAESFRNRIRLSFDGKTVRIKNEEAISESKKQEDVEVDEKQLMERVMKINPPEKDALPSVPVSVEKKADLPEKMHLTGGRPLPSPWSALGKLGLVLIIFGGIALLVKKMRNSQPSEKENSGWMGHLKKIAVQGFSKDGKMIQTVATHYLGPKKSLVVVKISGKTLVLGVTPESINLVAQINEGADKEDTDDFSDILDSKDSSQDDGNENLGPVAPVVGVRSRIKNRLEGLKPL